MLILITGLPGSGKSFFGRKLAAAVDAVYINSDEIRMKMNAKGKYSAEDKFTVYTEMADMASKMLRDKRDVIVDATFYRRALRELFEKLAGTYSAAFWVIEVRTDESTTRKRLSVKRAFSEADFTVYEKVRDEFEEITRPHLVLTSTDSNIEEMLVESKKYIWHVGSRSK